MDISDALLPVGLWAAIHLLLILFLTLRIVRMRITQGIGTGHGNNPTLERAIRAHGNITEHVPALLLGLALLALMGVEAQWIHLLGGTLFIGRLLHAYGIQVQSKPLPLTRVSGNVLTWLVTLIISGLLIWKFAKQIL